MNNVENSLYFFNDSYMTFGNTHYTIMDFLLSKYGLIFTEYDSIDRGGAAVNTFKFSKYQTIFTE